VPTEVQIETALSSLDTVKVGSPFLLFAAVYEQTQQTISQGRKELVKLWQELSTEHKGLFVAEFQQLRRRTAKAPRPSGEQSVQALTDLHRLTDAPQPSEYAPQPSEYATISSR